MGAFGYGVYDNDIAMDLRDNLANYLYNSYLNTEHPYPENIRVIANLIFGDVEFGDVSIRDKGEMTLTQVVLKKLKTINMDWYEGWKDPLKIKRYIKYMIDMLEN
mgnify:CR=1 FL=1